MAFSLLPIQTSGAGGAVVGSTAVQLTTCSARRYQRIVNAGPGTLWCTRDPLAIPTVAGPSCFPIAPHAVEEYPVAVGNYVPSAATSAVSDSTCNVSVEVD